MCGLVPIMIATIVFNTGAHARVAAQLPAGALDPCRMSVHHKQHLQSNTADACCKCHPDHFPVSHPCSVRSDVHCLCGAGAALPPEYCDGSSPCSHDAVACACRGPTKSAGTLLMCSNRLVALCGEAGVLEDLAACRGLSTMQL